MADGSRGDYPVSSALHASLRRARVSSLAEEQLRRQIVRGVWQPGQRLPAERRLAEDLHVSRASVREAIRGLEAMGMVDVRHGQGVFVRPPGVAPQHSFDGWGTRHQYAIGELLSFRLLIEPEVAALSAQHANTAFASQLASILDDMSMAADREDVGALVRLDTAFHDAIAVHAGNRLYVDLLAHVGQLLDESRRISLAVPGRPRRVISAHAAIAMAIASGDGRESADAMRGHLMLFSQDMGVRPAGGVDRARE